VQLVHDEDLANWQCSCLACGVGGVPDMYSSTDVAAGLLARAHSGVIVAGVVVKASSGVCGPQRALEFVVGISKSGRAADKGQQLVMRTKLCFGS
jgi:hypothetical protein